MKALDKYADSMSDRRYLFCETVLELMRRGHSYRDARLMANNSFLADKIEDETFKLVLFHSTGPEDWARCAENVEAYRQQRGDTALEKLRKEFLS